MTREFIHNTSKIAAFIQEGENLPLVFLHGFCEDSRIWDDFLENFSNQYIIRIDLPGFGQSEIKADYSITDMAHCVKSVLDSLKVDNCILIGHSMGGYVGLEFAKHYDKYLSAFCMFHSQPYADSKEKKLNRQKGIDFINDNGSIYYVKQLIPKLFAAKNIGSYSFVISKLIYHASGYKAKGIINALNAMKDRADNSSVLQNINCPVLFIIGALDEAIPSENSLNQTALPSTSSIHYLKNVGHMGMFEAQSTCTSILRNFIKFVDVKSTEQQLLHHNI